MSSRQKVSSWRRKTSPVDNPDGKDQCGITSYLQWKVALHQTFKANLGHTLTIAFQTTINSRSAASSDGDEWNVQGRLGRGRPSVWKCWNEHVGAEKKMADKRLLVSILSSVVVILLFDQFLVSCKCCWYAYPMLRMYFAWHWKCTSKRQWEGWQQCNDLSLRNPYRQRCIVLLQWP